MKHVRYSTPLLRVWLCVLALAGFQVAHAQGTAQGTQHFARSWTTGNEWPTGSGNPHPSADAACATTAAHPPNGITITGYTVNGLTCTVTGINTATGTVAAPYTYSIRTAAGAVTLPCPSSGSKAVRNFTLGYSNSPNDGAPSVPEVAAYSALINSSRCSVGAGASCGVSVAPQANMAYISTQPTSTGLYRVSVDIEVTFTGAACTASASENAESNAGQAVPPCPGTFGTVNGRPVCIPSVAPSPRPAPVAADGAAVPITTGNPAAGSNGSDSMGNRVPTTGTNGANNGSPITVQDGLPATWGKGLPATAGTTAGTSSSGGSSLKAEDIKTDCDKKPNSVGCSEYGTPDGSVQLGRSDSGFSNIGVVSFSAGAASCPQPITFSAGAHQFAVSYQPICDNAQSYIRPIVLVLGAALAAFVFVNGFKS